MLDKSINNVLSDRTLIPVSFVITLLGGILWLQTQLYAIRTDILNIRTSIEKIDIKSSDKWSIQDMVIWELQLKAQNPNMTIPSAKIILDARRNDSENKK